MAYLPDSFHEVNGVAHTSRQFEAFARRRGLPFLCVRAGTRELHHAQDKGVETLEIERGRLSIALEKDLRFDAGFARHLPQMARTLKAFRPDVIHVTGPSELGLLGLALAKWLRVPLAASWHTNLHEYAARRSTKLMDNERLAKLIEAGSLGVLTSFYSFAHTLFAPNAQICAMLAERTGRPCRLMARGVDADFFSPTHRQRPKDDGEFVLGYVGRFSREKNVFLLGRMDAELKARGFNNMRFLLVGQGGQEAWLREHLPQARFTGVLRGRALAEAFASMDAFVFPSHTDTFGNVVLEALASGVPAIVTADGGPCTIVRDGITGIVTNDNGFGAAVARLMTAPELHAQMRMAAREDALGASWDAVFDNVYAGYSAMLATPARRAKQRRAAAGKQRVPAVRSKG